MTDLTDNVVLATKDNRPFLERVFKRANTEHATLLANLHQALARDTRFSNINGGTDMMPVGSPPRRLWAAAEASFAPRKR